MQDDSIDTMKMPPYMRIMSAIELKEIEREEQGAKKHKRLDAATVH